MKKEKDLTKKFTEVLLALVIIYSFKMWTLLEIKVDQLILPLTRWLTTLKENCIYLKMILNHKILAFLISHAW